MEIGKSRAGVIKMPDLVTHVVMALVLIELFQVRKRSLVLLGAILPDIFAKVVLLRLFLPLPHIDYGVLSAFHVPFVFILFSLLLAPLFRSPYWKVVGSLTLGGLSHILADAFLRHFGDSGVKLFFPLLSQAYTLGWVWPDESFLLLFPGILMYLFLLWYRGYFGGYVGKRVKDKAGVKENG